RIVKFEVKRGATIDLSNDYPIFRYADILLMKAEAMIRQGQNGDFYVNEIRSRAGVPDLSGVNLDMLLEERGREMFWEAHRRQDLIRFGEYNKAWWEKPATLPDRNIFPIPQWAIDANPNLGN
ncbi:MAG: RagB/SusD family nutrient uptake outer membrane protein, partial [Bacteroidales bacterium]|nr:RagB/SusD family nutrient uptake outer membrane protein [Bacteroidales bacterium]